MFAGVTSLKMTRNDLQRDEAFLVFQKLVLEAQIAEEAEVTSSGLLTDRSIFDPLAYATWRFGADSPQVMPHMA